MTFMIYEFQFFWSAYFLNRQFCCLFFVRPSSFFCCFQTLSCNSSAILNHSSSFFLNHRSYFYSSSVRLTSQLRVVILYHVFCLSRDHKIFSHEQIKLPSGHDDLRQHVIFRYLYHELYRHKDVQSSISRASSIQVVKQAYDDHPRKKMSGQHMICVDTWYQSVAKCLVSIQFFVSKLYPPAYSTAYDASTWRFFGIWCFFSIWCFNGIRY
jgi:hypothetical protein